MIEVRLSLQAVATLRFEIKGWRAKVPGQRLAEYRELAAVGLMEPLPGSETEYRFTEEGLTRREAILREEEDRIESERYSPPDDDLILSEAARELLGRRVSGEFVPVDETTRPADRELAAAGIMEPLSGFVLGAESSFRFTYHGWNRRHEWLSRPDGSP